MKLVPLDSALSLHIDENTLCIPRHGSAVWEVDEGRNSFVIKIRELQFRIFIPAHTMHGIVQDKVVEVIVHTTTQVTKGAWEEKEYYKHEISSS